MNTQQQTTSGPSTGETVKVLSIRQPWAWLIVNGYKDIENRKWATEFRGRFLVHASKTMKLHDYQDAVQYAHQRGVVVPSFDRMEYGGIVGEVNLIDCVNTSKSEWFQGPWGFVLATPRPMNFLQCKGKLGFFSMKLKG